MSILKRLNRMKRWLKFLEEQGLTEGKGYGLLKEKIIQLKNKGK